MLFKTLAKVCNSVVHTVTLPTLSTVDARYAFEQECERFIKSSCPHGRWSNTLWDTTEDRVSQKVTVRYYFEDERDAIFFKMRFS